jgi:hypothetical protein
MAMRTLNVSFALGGLAFALSTQLGGCNAVSDDCSTYETCPAGGSSGTGGTEGESGAPGGGSEQGGQAGKGGTNAAGSNGSSGDAGTGGLAGMSGEGGAAGNSTQEQCKPACGSPKPICDEANNTCVECLEPDDCPTGLKTKCNDNNICVECLNAATDCVNASASRCDNGACAKCMSNADCEHIAGAGVCDDGSCVACTVADDSACGTKSCNLATKSCTQTTKGTVATCKPCLADNECVGGNQADPDARCVPMEFQGTPRPGGFCLRRAAKTCTRPYTIGITGQSLSGASAENYCGIDQQNVTCEAVVDLVDSRTCAASADTACGCKRDKDGKCTDAGKGGLCRDLAVVQDRCTYQCGTTDHCPVGSMCLGTTTTYCQ